jgi:hypothetical protein
MQKQRSDSSLSEPLLPLQHNGDDDYDDDNSHYRRSSSASSAVGRHHKSSGMGFTWKHILYLIVMMTIGAALLDAIINGGLAALMYHDQVRSHLVPCTLQNVEFILLWSISAYHVLCRYDHSIIRLLHFIVPTFISNAVDNLISIQIAVFFHTKQGNIRVWEWPNTLGGDIMVTTLLTGILTWIIASNLVMRYVAHIF